MVPNESEVFVLQSFLYTGRLVVNQMERGQEYSGLRSGYRKSIGFGSTNPRAKMMKIQMDMGTARFFGTDPKSFCPQAKELLAKWTSSNQNHRFTQTGEKIRWKALCERLRIS